MRNALPQLHSPIRQQRFPVLARRTLLPVLVATFTAFPSLPLVAAEPGHAGHHHLHAAPGNAPWISGGVGDEAFAAMRSSASDYNVHVLFTGRHGAYLADIPFSVKARNGEEVLSGISAGPLLYLRLPAGNYQLAAKLNDAWQSQRIQVSNLPGATRARFVSQGE